MPLERSRQRLRKALTPCCAGSEDSNGVHAAGFDSSKPSYLADLPAELFERVCFFLRPVDVIRLSECSQAACQLARSSRMPWKKLDVFLHNPHRHLSGTKRITQAWPHVRFVFRVHETLDGTTEGVFFGREQLCDWMTLAELPCVRGVDFSRNLIDPSLTAGEGDALWIAAMANFKLGIFCSNNSIVNLKPFAHMVYVDLSFNGNINDDSLKPLKHTRHLVLRNCHAITRIADMECEIIDAPNCNLLREVGNVPACFWLNLRNTALSSMYNIGTNLLDSQLVYP